MSQETFIGCDAPGCNNAVRLGSSEAELWWSASFSWGRNDGDGEVEEGTVDACSEYHLGPALAVHFTTEGP